MRIALISPYSNGPLRGNIVTVRRIAHFLDQAGAVTATLAVDSFTIAEMHSFLMEFKPDLIHGFHAHYCGAITRQLAARLQIPYVITITGSDLHDALLRNHPETVGAIENAHAVVCFHASDAEKLTGFFPGTCEKVAVVPQGVKALPVVGGGNTGFDRESFILLLPAALRPVKGVEFPLRALSQPALNDQSLRLVIAGGVIDNDYAAVIRGLLSDSAFATWLGEVPHEQMGNLYARADLVLNCSRSESMPNSLMEAMAGGKTVLAANIPGNRSLVQHGITGWLYDNEADFRKMVLYLRENESLRTEAGQRAKEYIMTTFSPQLEAKRYLSLYRKLAAA